jgi:hypothetical protein
MAYSWIDGPFYVSLPPPLPNSQSSENNFTVAFMHAHNIDYQQYVAINQVECDDSDLENHYWLATAPCGFDW